MIEAKLIIAGQEGYTGYCDQDGEKIFIGDRLEFTDFSGAVWQADVIYEDGIVTICTWKGVEEIKSPEDWTRPHKWIKSRNWSVMVGYGEYGTWNVLRKSIADIAGGFKIYDEFVEAEDKFAERNSCYAHEQLWRPLPVRKVWKQLDQNPK